MFANIRIVLCRTTHPGNIGAAARAMKTMCLDRLVLVAPEHFPSAEATSRSSGAADVLEQAVVCDTLAEAVADCQVVFGASARRRSITVPDGEAREAASDLVSLSADHQVAMVFGQERSGMDNDEVALCHRLVQIPANPDYGSLNMASAVQLICYEIHMARLARGQAPVPASIEPDDARATQGHFDSFMAAWMALKDKVEFGDEKQSASLDARFRRLFMRAELTSYEVDMLRGMLSKIDKKVPERT